MTFESLVDWGSLILDSWRQRAYIKGSNTEAFDEFGSSVSFDRTGSLHVVSARGEDSGAKGVGGDEKDNSVDEAGAVYVFSMTK